MKYQQKRSHVLLDLMTKQNSWPRCQIHVSHCITFFNKNYQRAAHQLLKLVLKPTEENLKKAKKMYLANPRLLFIESIAKEYAAGLDDNLKNVHRIVQASPIRAMAGANDRWLLKEVIETDEFKKHVDPASKKTANELAVDEINKQFPNGFEFPASTYDYGLLLDAITNDQSLIQNNVPSAVTKALLAQFRKHFLPGTIVTSGHFFNLNELVRAFEIYEENFRSRSPWQGNQLSLFWREVMGYFEGLVSGVVGEVISQGIMNVIEGSPPKRQYNFENYASGRESYFPLAEDPSSRLGLSFGVDSYYSGAGFDRFRRCQTGATGYWDAYKIYVEQQQRAWTDLCYNFSNSQPSMRV